MTKLWSWGLVAGFAGTSCTSGPPDGTYTVVKSTTTCTMGGASKFVFTAGSVTVTYGTPFLVPTSSTSTVTSNGDAVTFDAMFSARNTDSGDGAYGTEHYALTVDGDSLNGTVDGSYNEQYNGKPSSCMSTFDITATRAAS